MIFKRNHKKEKVHSDHKVSKRIGVGIAIGIIIILAGLALYFFPTLFKVAPNAGIVNSLIRSIPGVSNDLKSTEDGRTNVVLLGMRGEGVEGGGLLADTIMIASIREGSQNVSLMSIPRDLYVTVPESSEQRKINAVHALGEEKGKGEGLEYMKKILSEVLGQEMHYAVSINFAGFEELIDALGGVDVSLEEPFIEPLQFHKEQVCDPLVFTVPSGNFEEKISGSTGKVKARYPLCYNADEECGGIFEVPAGESTLSGEEALCYVRSRETSNDFERARRQQEVMKQLKEKALNLGIISDFDKINGLMSALGNNVRTDLQLWEIKKFFERAQTINTSDIQQKVLENTEEGLLYTPEEHSSAGYILLPRGNNYEKIHETFSSLLPKETSTE